MSGRPHATGRGGFTLVEVMITTAILMAVVTVAMTSAVQLLHRQAILLRRMDMQSEGQLMYAFLQTTSRLSNSQEMVMYPEEGTHLAVSYPLPGAMDEEGEPNLDADGKLIWGDTVILHAWPPDNPKELRLTRFRPRHNDLGLDQRREQLESVATNGVGTDTHNGANSNTRTVARLNSRFEFISQSNTYNFYAPTRRPHPGEVLGGVLMEPGDNTLLFRSTEQSGGGAGRGLILDKLYLSPAGLPIEAEAMLPATRVSGATPVVLADVGAKWSNLQALSFPARSQGAELELTYYNDTWFETRFTGSHSEFENCMVVLNQEEETFGYWLRPMGRELAWTAPFQVRSQGAAGDDTDHAGARVRVLVKSGDEGILADGDGCTITFRAAEDADSVFHILNAYIHEAAGSGAPAGTGIRTDTTTRLRFGSLDAPANGVRMSPGDATRTLPADFPIDRTKNYVISYELSVPADGAANRPFFWADSGGETHAYLAPSTEGVPPPSLTEGSWDGHPELRALAGVPGVDQINTTYFNQAVYLSNVVDTSIEDPEFGELDWEAHTPDDTSVTLQVRSSNGEDMFDAAGWENLPVLRSPGQVDAGTGRYVQVRVTLHRDRTTDAAPELRYFSLKWPGPSRRVDFGGDFIRDPAGGIYEVLINDTPPTASFRAELEVTKNVPGGQESWRMSTETTPRN